MRPLDIALALSLILSPLQDAASQPSYEPHRAPDVRRQPYRGYTTVDSLGRTIRFFVSEEPDTARLPLAIYVQGSGHGSHFRREGDRTIPANGHGSLADVMRGKARVVIVEKPGVDLFDDGSSAQPAFAREFSLERWAEAVAAAALAARKLRGVDSARALIIGHSEGGIVAARVAGRLPWITHAAILAGGGPSQLEDLRILARSGKLFAERGATPIAREAYVLAAWDTIRADPTSTDRTWFGHTYLRWSSFLASSTITEILRSRSAVFVAQGADDPVVARDGFDQLVEALRLARRPTAGGLITGADHSFAQEGGGDGWAVVLDAVARWFDGVKPPASRSDREIRPVAQPHQPQ